MRHAGLRFLPTNDWSCKGSCVKKAKRGAFNIHVVVSLLPISITTLTMMSTTGLNWLDIINFSTFSNLTSPFYNEIQDIINSFDFVTTCSNSNSLEQILQNIKCRIDTNSFTAMPVIMLSLREVTIPILTMLTSWIVWK